ncbi:MAG: radical SAM family heme chaperone HemW [Bacteroidales bacterium]|jgi:oxygen-independent coproporphyrinogen-3 oxidase|nr:radical SAM family heme chaperone HemW [Bacteroidales bacterium]MDD2687770.1 radical SAM family heme chaperone HemW [Bacteroidales bacterium]MDD3331301.1 radical SAM family heme chaperone HemW [Bacteroidales bacterium]MDD3692033.1 radical SAM family heme chaperone HemW [Bacteroidales bacterium]MDD4045352.1 radical SAM family heme chaperone HemW [Bacteroidales bacterium]
MSAVYIHIPFCVRKCAYCTFYSVCDTSLISAYVSALKKEMWFRSAYFTGELAHSLYIGGGTPSLLSINHIQDIIHTVSSIFKLDVGAEISLEANPDSLNEEYIRKLKDCGVNRLSIGVQSFYEDDLRTLNRLHTAKQAETCIDHAYKHGFTNLSVDLMYGFPGLSLSKWKHNLEKLKNIPHLSCYQLSLEKDTSLFESVRNKKHLLPSEDETMEQYEYLTSFAQSNHFIHYEISNFCKSGYASKHNSAYWENKKYIGLGPGAHSYDRIHRQWNIADIQKYISFMDNISDPIQYHTTAEDVLFEKEILTLDMRYNEYVMTSLRTLKGCKLSYIQSQLGNHYVKHLQQQLSSIPQAYYILTETDLRLTEKGRLFADFVASTLFI